MVSSGKKNGIFGSCLVSFISVLLIYLFSIDFFYYFSKNLLF